MESKLTSRKATQMLKEVGRKVDFKRARKMLTCQSSVHGDVFKYQAKASFFQFLFDIICVIIILRINGSTKRFLKLSRFEYWEFLS